jgi:hypothetical protein
MEHYIVNANYSNYSFYLSATISLSKYMQTVNAENKVISSTTCSVLSFPGIDLSEFTLASVAGTIETASGVENVTDATL